MPSPKSSLLAHYARLLTRWPVDRLRPESLHFQRLLQHRIQNPEVPPISPAEANASYLLLDNTFGKKYPLSERMMKPDSQPEHYQNLAHELEQAPDRGWFDKFKKRIGGMIRWR